MKQHATLAFLGSVIFTMVITIILLGKIVELRKELQQFRVVAYERDNELYNYMAFGEQPSPWYTHQVIHQR